MKKHYLFLLNWLGAVSVAQAQNPPITGANIVKSVYQGRSLRATNSIELQPGFSVSMGGFEARVAPPPATAGSWTDPLPWWLPMMNKSFVGIHTHVLPNGKVLSWEGHNDNLSHITESHSAIWNPADASFAEFDNLTSNIFCSGHAFLPDGRLFVAGGHHSNGQDPTIFPADVPLNSRGYIGIKDVNTFDWFGTTQPNGVPWTRVYPDMNDRRWYPTVTTLNDGRMLVIAGQRYGGSQSVIPEIWNNGAWTRLPGAQNLTIPNYPWMFATPNGKAFYAGPGGDTRYLNPSATAPAGGLGVWEPVLNTSTYASRDYGSAVMYEKGKILIVGGGVGNNINTASAQWIDLMVTPPFWRSAGTMQYPRMHHMPRCCRPVRCS